MGVALQFSLFTKYLGPSWGDKETVQYETKKTPNMHSIIYTRRKDFYD